MHVWSDWIRGRLLDENNENCCDHNENVSQNDNRSDSSEQNAFQPPEQRKLVISYLSQFNIGIDLTALMKTLLFSFADISTNAIEMLVLSISPASIKIANIYVWLLSTPANLIMNKSKFSQQHISFVSIARLMSLSISGYNCWNSCADHSSWLTDWLTDWLIDWLTDWLTEGQSGRTFCSTQRLTFLRLAGVLPADPGPAVAAVDLHTTADHVATKDQGSKQVSQAYPEIHDCYSTVVVKIATALWQSRFKVYIVRTDSEADNGGRPYGVPSFCKCLEFTE